MMYSLPAALSKLSRKRKSLLPSSFQEPFFFSLDLSIQNKALSLELLQDPEAHHQYIQKLLSKNNAKVAYGGYLEQRALYDRSDYFQATTSEEKRNIHLGMDMWCEAGTRITSPLDGVIHSFKNNTNFGDYGPTIILEHFFEGFSFYTLYGHLSRESLEGKSKGQVVKAGEAIARLGTADENGNYAPHLHFQLIKDMQGMEGDYPGVCSQSTLEFYKENCPDPNLLLQIH